MNLSFLTGTPLFCGISESEANAMLSCLQAEFKNFSRGETVLSLGDQTDSLGLVLSGSVLIRQPDFWGNENLISRVQPGQVFAETYACIPDCRMTVQVLAVEDSGILFLNVRRILHTCPSSCAFHSRLIENLLSVLAFKNLNLTRKISHTTPKSIRGRLLSYLSFQSIQQGSRHISIPFSRQQLADYLCVDRSALSNELSKMQKDGLLTCKKNSFSLHDGTLLED